MDLLKYRLLLAPYITVYDIGNSPFQNKPFNETVWSNGITYHTYITIKLLESFNLVLGLNIFPNCEITISSEIRTVPLTSGQRYTCYELIKN